ncbi:MAG: thiamine pyrophosphate-binding protein [Candidatus Bathyarchaeota archaeon]|nr:thiamine pyrophosphate-binding protein [Candidatus Bathyarchaeota archaeon]
MQNPTVGEYLLGELKRFGIKRAYGIPGDMIIKFFKLLEDDPDVELCTFSHEPAVGFAAIAEARALRKPTVAVVTYGAGAFNTMNPVACAYAEKTPLIIVSGGPAIAARTKDFYLHHTVKSCVSQLDAYSEITKEAVLLDSAKTAAAKISKALTACKEYQLPVYIELPADVVEREIRPNQKTPETLTSDAINLQKAIKEIAKRISAAATPVIMVGVESDRLGLKKDVLQLAEKLNLPVVSTLLARDLIISDEPNFFGTYLSEAGNPIAGKLVEESDMLLILGEMLSDVNLGAKLTATKGDCLVWCFSREVHVGDVTYENIALVDLVKGLCRSGVEKKKVAFPQKTQPKINRTCKLTPSPLVMSEVIDAINWFFSEFGKMPLIADTGDCLFATLRIEASSVVAPAFYSTMGFAVPAAIGYALATKKRPLVLIGDGSFQMTGPEICHCPRYSINPMFVVINNRRWGMEQLFYPSARFNELVNWQYAEMAQLWGGKGYKCTKCEDLYRALEEAKDQKNFTLIEVVTEREELSEELLAWIKEQRHEK